VLQALSFVFKLGQRHRLLPHAACVWELLGPICGAGSTAGSKAAAAAAAQGKAQLHRIQNTHFTEDERR